MVMAGSCWTVKLSGRDDRGGTVTACVLRRHRRQAMEGNPSAPRSPGLEALMTVIAHPEASPQPAAAHAALAPGASPPEAFAARHIGPSPAEIEHMLATTGFGSLDELTGAALPREIGHEAHLSLPAPLTEPEALAELRRLAAQNKVLTSMIGLGYYGTTTPAVIRRNVLENPAWYTAYTPYQPEISQGRLEALLNFQTMVSDLTGLPVAGASLLDEPTAAAEAMTLARRAVRPAAVRPTPKDGAPKDGAGSVFLADADCLPQTLAVLRTRAQPLGIRLVVAEPTPEVIGGLAGDLFGVLLQYPGASGEVRDLRPAIEAAHACGALATVAADLLALTLVRPPGELAADIAIGSTQRFGVPPGFGGPSAAYIAVRDELKRQLPGRLVGVSVDAAGNPAYRLALQAREQHIRREKATSNICTAQVLLAVIAAMYAAYHGPAGLTAIARRVRHRAATLAAAFGEFGLETGPDAFFDTIRVTIPGGGAAAAESALQAGYNLYLADPDTVQISCDETTTEEHLLAVVRAVTGCSAGEAAQALKRGAALESARSADAADALPRELRRESEFLTHPVFHSYQNETAMLRYLRRLADRDIALDRSMIPLGSCTMKLNAAAEMEPITWPEFASLHPFVPAGQSRGYAELIGDLERWLAGMTGYDAVSLQPNAGSQGELAGLLAIRGYHASRGQSHRDVCLIPGSAHGTNAASATLAGLRVVVVKCGADGVIDGADLAAKLAEHGQNLAAIMVTYPSTNGVFEETIVDVCRAVHDAGGQVYVDGANMNALVGLARPGEFGADVSHLNLHKTFCIPHGGGGPGVGPVAARAHLAAFLPPSVPGIPRLNDSGDGAGPVAGAPWGSAGILPISWAYVRMMGAAGLRLASQVAILAANYVAKRLAPHYQVLYTGPGGLVAHECVIDLRGIARETGITNEDVAKRLIDYGFHAPTMSFPVAGTLMIEPTESEDLTELDRFCDAMIAIRHEIGKVAAGEYDPADNPLKNAPHTAEMLVVGEWEHPYRREDAAYPASGDGAAALTGAWRADKYWPPVRRIDQAYGDRHLICACPDPAAFEAEPGAR
jgi:glycine cleavage system P protein (glycine dehydrogenase)